MQMKEQFVPRRRKVDNRKSRQRRIKLTGAAGLVEVEEVLLKPTGRPELLGQALETMGSHRYYEVLGLPATATELDVKKS